MSAVDDALLATGWRFVLRDGSVTCPRNETVEFFRDGWDKPVQSKYCHLHPELNVWRLFWRPLTN